MKNEFKEKFYNVFNKERNYQTILKKIERSEKEMNNRIRLLIFLPICLLIILGSVVYFYDFNEVKTFTTHNGNKIVINSLNEVASGQIDARMDIDGKIQENAYEFDFIDNMQIPDNLYLVSQYIVYTKDSSENKDTDAPYDILHDYVLWYESKPRNDGLIENKIIITFSKDYEPLRCYFIDTNSLVHSEINGIKLTIANYNETYITNFSYNNLNFDIETVGIDENTLVDLLESIII